MKRERKTETETERQTQRQTERHREGDVQVEKHYGIVCYGITSRSRREGGRGH